jgi:hypothetical protein
MINCFLIGLEYVIAGLVCAVIIFLSLALWTIVSDIYERIFRLPIDHVKLFDAISGMAVFICGCFLIGVIVYSCDAITPRPHSAVPLWTTDSISGSTIWGHAGTCAVFILIRVTNY